jgi:hypothetical protein
MTKAIINLRKIVTMRLLKLLFTVLLIGTMLSCVVQQNVEKQDTLVIRNIEQQTTFNPAVISAEIENGVVIEISPVDAIELNDITRSIYPLSGNYNRGVMTIDYESRAFHSTDKSY